MARYSVAEARNNLPKLIDKALAGEEVTITRRGVPVVRIAPERPSGVAEHPIDPPASAYDLEWLDRHRVTPKCQDPEWDSDKLIRRMRDEGY
jgi:prevent-host-death family protein